MDAASVTGKPQRIHQGMDHGEFMRSFIVSKKKHRSLATVSLAQRLRNLPAGIGDYNNRTFITKSVAWH